jgi:hypothetical protein
MPVYASHKVDIPGIMTYRDKRVGRNVTAGVLTIKDRPDKCQ